MNSYTISAVVSGRRVFLGNPEITPVFDNDLTTPASLSSFSQINFEPMATSVTLFLDMDYQHCVKETTEVALRVGINPEW